MATYIVLGQLTELGRRRSVTRMMYLAATQGTP
jgi:hypothetical protein